MHAQLHCMEEDRFRKFAHDPGNISKPFESSVNMAQGEYSIGCPGVGISECSI
jgi:hypothetical protein